MIFQGVVFQVEGLSKGWSFKGQSFKGVVFQGVLSQEKWSFKNSVSYLVWIHSPAVWPHAPAALAWRWWCRCIPLLPQSSGQRSRRLPPCRSGETSGHVCCNNNIGIPVPSQLPCSLSLSLTLFYRNIISICPQAPSFSLWTLIAVCYMAYLCECMCGCVCVCACVCACVIVRASMHACVHACICVCLSVCMCVSMCVCACVCVGSDAKDVKWSVVVYLLHN